MGHIIFGGLPHWTPRVVFSVLLHEALPVRTRAATETLIGELVPFAVASQVPEAMALEALFGELVAGDVVGSLGCRQAAETLAVEHVGERAPSVAPCRLSRRTPAHLWLRRLSTALSEHLLLAVHMRGLLALYWAQPHVDRHPLGRHSRGMLLLAMTCLLY